VTPGTYYWQVKTVGGGVAADNGVWRAVTVTVPPFLKQAPANLATGPGNDVTLQWSAVPNEGYWVCWDTIDNGTCDTMWWPTGAAAAKPLSGLAPAMYYWQVKTAGSGAEADGGTWWRFTVTMPLVPADHWKAEYFGNQDVSGALVAVVDEGTGVVDHGWGDGGPAGLADHFSARFTRTVSFAAGRYRFTVTTDDGSRLWVDDQLTIDAWGATGLTTHTVELDLAAGAHALRYEYVEHTGGATTRLTWALLTPVVLASGEALWENQSRVSLDGAYRLQYQGDGNLVVVRLADESCGWSSQTNGTSVGATIMQGDGNLVVYNADWTAVWNAGTGGHDGARLEIANDELAVVAADGTKLWWVSLAAAPARPTAWAGATMGTVLGALSWPAGRAAGVLLVLIALIGLAAKAVRRPWSPGGPQADSRKPHVARGLWARLSATALLLTAMMLVPASALAQIPTQVVEYYHTDALGSVRAVTKQVNGQWQVVARHDFMPFGEEVSPPSPPQDKRLFTGKERDNETALDYFEARYLRTSTGRFTSVDPLTTIEDNLVDPQRWNRYAYALNNPLKYTDPDGKVPVPAIIGAAAAARWLATPQGQRVMNVAVARAQSVWIAAIEFFNSPGGQETVQMIAEFATGAEIPASRTAAAAHGVEAGFDSFRALKRSWGPAGDGLVWHHIVEQSKAEQFSKQMINAPGNVVAVAREINENLNAFYSSKQPFSGKLTVRDWLKGKSWQEQYRLGLEWLDKALKGEL
jgi:RHS repeat-associated protein